MSTSNNSLHNIKNKLGLLSLFIESAYPGYQLTREDSERLAELKLALDNFINTTKEEISGFENIRDEYSFFQKHSSEAEACIQAMTPFISPFLKKEGVCRFFDFGCGDGKFTSTLLESLKGRKANIQFNLLDVDSTYLNQAKAHLNHFSSLPMITGMEPSESFDIGIANHSFYYVEDIRSSLVQIYNKMRKGSQFLITIANRRNDLVVIHEALFKLLGKEFPKFLGEDVKKTLIQLNYDFIEQEIVSGFNFSDTADNRKCVLKFIDNVETAGLSAHPNFLKMFDPYKVGPKICLNLVDQLFIIKK